MLRWKRKEEKDRRKGEGDGGEGKVGAGAGEGVGAGVACESNTSLVSAHAEGSRVSGRRGEEDILSSG